MPKKLTPRQRAGRENRKKWQGFTPEGLEALRQSALDNRPWERSTGPRTPAGKKRSRENAIKHGGRSFATLPSVAQGFIRELRAAEDGDGSIPDDLAAITALMTGGGLELAVRGCNLLLRHQRLTRGLVS